MNFPRKSDQNDSMYFLLPLFLRDIETLVNVEAQLSWCSELSDHKHLSSIYSELCTLYTLFLVAKCTL